MELPSIIQAALGEAQASHAAAANAYGDLVRLVRLENRRRLNILHRTLEDKGLGYCSGCNLFKPRHSLELRFWPKWAGCLEGSISAVCPRCQSGRFDRDFVRPARVAACGFEAQTETGNWVAVQVKNGRPGEWAFLPRSRVTPKMAKRFGLQESIRLPRHCRPGITPELTAFAQ